jgi:hypothetical protein
MHLVDITLVGGENRGLSTANQFIILKWWKHKKLYCKPKPTRHKLKIGL